ncbi:MAG: N-formylglutamate deformylase [Kordiimonadaceae bacterium]|nr:N-formylglutamate deformylase [Kordiimonadaceae bacterium]
MKRGTSPLIVSLPHSGTALGPFASRMTEIAQQNADCDWHLPTLYSFLYLDDATVLRAKYSRYVIDLNRDPTGKSLYPGQNVTELCPTTTFDNSPIYIAGQQPTEAEIETRIDQYWVPYHDALQAEISRVKDMFGFALLWDAHSVRSCVPRFFEGTLPDLNFGTNDNQTCDPALVNRVLDSATQLKGYETVLNGRFKGGYITRTYGDPRNNVHALQLELSQATYMKETYPYNYLPMKAEVISKTLASALCTMQNWKPAGA